MKHLLLVTLFLLTVLSSCSPGKIQEGEITYTITYPNSEISSFMQAILPETMTITFKGTRVKSTIARGEIFTTDIISNEADQSLEMRLEFGDKMFYSTLDEADIKSMMNSQPVYDITSLNKKDSILGLLAQSYAVKEASDTVIRETAWFSEDLVPVQPYWFTSYNSINGMPLIFDIERYGVMMHLKMTHFEAREVNDAEFNRNDKLQSIPYDQFEIEVQELFDILM